ncbi:MAG: DUF362 domain-containing protein [Verrucomicrobia bacterium]|nr:DUF362 domain-containing protein [Verrucomicrobiota bacterium]MBU1735255.1 DUF362 domain-containing protein [Verrucomicrobiota bacterium]MBU1857607.1 DUF362 domain-containing protein [Verrucomicrobiota bacterium]
MPTPVVLAKCATYNFTEVLSATERIIAALGGLHRFIRPGQTVLLKPNLLTASTPDQAVTTHPAVIRALIHMVRAAGATPIVGDSASAALIIEDVWEQTGYRALCTEEAVALIRLEQAGSRRFEFDGVAFSIARPVFDADLVINVPKVKTHIFTVFTGAVKNMYGVVPGYQKTMLHKLYRDPRRFGDFIARLYAIVKPALTIADAVTAMEGNGPSAGTPVNYGFLAGAADGVALDTALCHVLHINPHQVPYFPALQQAHTGETRWHEITLLGDSPKALALRPIRLPGVFVGHFAPMLIYHWLGRYLWIRPTITERCVACGLCLKACPVSAIHATPGKRPTINYRQCISCCCCHEVCQAKAIELRQSFLLNLIQNPNKVEVIKNTFFTRRRRPHNGA